MAGTELIRALDQEIERRENLLVSFPKVLQEKARSMGLSEERLNIMIEKRNGLFVNIKEEKIK